MNKDLKIYGNNFNYDVLKDIDDINKKLETEESEEEILKLRMQRLYRGMELNCSIAKRNIRGYYPY